LIFVLVGALRSSAETVATGAASSTTPESAATTSAHSSTLAAPRRSPWEVSPTLRGSIGMRNNILLSALQPIDRSFWEAEADLFVSHPLGAHAQLIAYLDGDVLRYFSPPKEIPGEQQWAADLEARWQPTTYLSTVLKGVAFLQDAFIDPSITEGLPDAVIGVRAEGSYALLAPKVKLPGGFSLEPSLQVKRITFAQFGSYGRYPGENTESRPGVRIEWKRSDRLVLSAAWFEHRRHYSELTQSTAGGRSLRGRLLGLVQKEGELKAATTFDAKGKWTVAATAGRFENRDRTFGYLDYNQKSAKLDVTWRRAAWRASVTGEAKHLDYLVQKVGSGIASQRPPRITDASDVTARLERDVAAHWTIFAEDRWERNRSNFVDIFDFHPFSYRTNTARVGIERSF
jgi:hypothetical protein